MNRICFLIAFLCMLTPGSIVAQDASVPAEGLDWRPFEEAVDEAKSQNKKLIVDVYVKWCSWCRRLQRETYMDAVVQGYVREHFVLTRLDGEEQGDTLAFRGYTLTPAELAQGLMATGFPTTVFLDANGEYITRMPGFADPAKFLDVLSYIATDSFIDVPFENYVGKGN